MKLDGYSIIHEAMSFTGDKTIAKIIVKLHKALKLRRKKLAILKEKGASSKEIKKLTDDAKMLRANLAALKKAYGESFYT